MIRNFLNEALIQIEKINKIQFELHEPLLNSEDSPLGTVNKYFSTKELKRIISNFLTIKKEFIKLDLFKDEFEKCKYFKISELDTFITVIDSQDFDHVFDHVYMSSKHSLRLWDIDYRNVISTLITEMEELVEKIKLSSDNWYIKHKYMINDNVFINKQNFTIYKIIGIDYNTSTILLEKCGYQKFGNSLSVENIQINCNEIRDSIEDEVFIATEVGKIHPELFL